MLLARVADDLYWAARYLERAEDTARIVREHTNLIVDLPASSKVSWDPLLAVTGGDLIHSSPAQELDVVAALVADPLNPASISACIAGARQNLRSCREVVPREFWLTVNDLHLYTAAHAAEGVDRRSRGAFLSRVIGETQRAIGILGGVMSSDHAYEMLRLGRTIERADMTTRVLDVRAVAVVTDDDPQYADVQWGAVLRSLGALQMYNRTRSEPVEAAPVVDFLLHDRAFPRSVRCCLDKVVGSVLRLPLSDAIEPTVEAAITELVAMTPTGSSTESATVVDATALRLGLDRIQVQIAEVSDALCTVYFSSR